MAWANFWTKGSDQRGGVSVPLLLHDPLRELLEGVELLESEQSAEHHEGVAQVVFLEPAEHFGGLKKNVGEWLSHGGPYTKRVAGVMKVMPWDPQANKYRVPDIRYADGAVYHRHSGLTSYPVGCVQQSSSCPQARGYTCRIVETTTGRRLCSSCGRAAGPGE